VLVHSMMFGLAASIADLLFNFYLVSLGYASDAAGLLSTVSRMAGVVLGLPIGLLIDRLGGRRAVLIGVLGYSFGWLLLLLFARTLWALALAQFLIGGALILTLTAVVPLLTAVTLSSRRATFFGLNASAALMIGLVGSAVGGVLPALAGQALNSGSQSMEAYRLALASVVVLGVVAALPMLHGLPDTNQESNATPEDTITTRLPPLTLVRYALPSFLLGVGGGAILPFQNLFFRQEFNLNDAAVGVILAWGALGMGLGGLLGAPISARFGLQRAAAWLRICAAPAMLIMLAPLLAPATAGFFLRGLFVAASYPLNDALVMQSTPAIQRGIAISLLSILWSLGWAGAAAVSGWAQIHWGFTPVLIGAAIAYAISGVLIVTLSVKK
jgi:MFS family permease